MGEFESIFLLDLEGGELPSRDSHGGLQGEFKVVHSFGHMLLKAVYKKFVHRISFSITFFSFVL